MSRADQLGAGRFAANGVSSRRQAVAAATGAATVGADDSRLKTIPLGQLAPTRFNPRRNFGTYGDLVEFGLKLKNKQLQPARAVTREAYLRLWEEEADSVGAARYVLANGERRFRSSLAADLETLEVIIDDTIAVSKAVFLDAVLSENNDREDLDPIERALGIETMVVELGGADQVAAHYGKTKGWVSQQRKLLKLTPALQDLVSSNTMPIRVARDIAGLPPNDQDAAWAAEVRRREGVKAAPRERSPKRSPAKSSAPALETPSDGAERFTAVNQNSDSGMPGAGVVPAEGSPAVQVDEASAESIPAARQGKVGHTEEECNTKRERAGGIGPAESADVPDVSDVVAVRKSTELGRLPSRAPDALAKLIIAELGADDRRDLTTILVNYNDAETNRMKGHA